MTTAALVLATRNDHKVREFERLLPDVELSPLPADAEVPAEDGDTYAANALIKARAAARATGRPAVADDSGVEAEAIGWRPGVRSARYAGPHATDADNREKLKAEAPPHSRLRYVCVIAHVDPQTGDERLFEGTCTGTMAATERGDNGFGYDPLFVPDGERRTMAELGDAEKHAISHRGRAARALAAWLSAG